MCPQRAGVRARESGRAPSHALTNECGPCGRESERPVTGGIRGIRGKDSRLCKRWWSWNPKIFRGQKQRVEDIDSHFAGRGRGPTGRLPDSLRSLHKSPAWSQCGPKSSVAETRGGSCGGLTPSPRGARLHGAGAATQDPPGLSKLGRLPGLDSWPLCPSAPHSYLP